MNFAMHPLLIQVLPRLTPGRCGVSDHAVPLARELKTGFGIDSAFVILNSSERCDLPYAAAYCLPAKLLESCLEFAKGRPGFVLVHVSGYGYSPDGAPRLVADALEQVRASGRFRTAAYFHEIFASGLPWKSAFWHSRRQRGALLDIAAQCNLIVTNTRRHAEWLASGSRKTDGTPIAVMPVFSTVGETDDPVPFRLRKAALVVFGQAGTRKLAYRQMAAAGNLMGALGLEEILDIGPECAHPSQVGGVRVKRIGMLAAEELPSVLSQAQFGFVTHKWSYLARSSVLAAYCAHGTIPVMTGPFPREADGLRDGVNVVSPRTSEAVRRAGWQVCSHAAWKWYKGHRLSAHVELYAKWMGETR